MSNGSSSKPRRVAASRPAPRGADSQPGALWQLQNAKARFSELFRRARAEGPQRVTRQDKEAVVILAAEEYERLAGRARQAASLSKFFAESPLVGAGLDLERAADYGREVDL